MPSSGLLKKRTRPVWSLAMTEITTATQITVPINGTIAIWPVWSVRLKFLCPWQHSAGWTCGGPAGCCSKLHATHATLPPAHISQTQTDTTRQLCVHLMYFVQRMCKTKQALTILSCYSLTSWMSTNTSSALCCNVLPNSKRLINYVTTCELWLYHKLLTMFTFVVTHLFSIGLEVLTAVTTNSTFVSHVTLSNLVQVYWHFRETLPPSLRSNRAKQAELVSLLPASCLAYSPKSEDRSNMFLQTFVIFFQTTWHHIWEDGTVQRERPPANWGCDSSLTTATGYRPESQETGSIPGMAKEFFSFPPHPVDVIDPRFLGLGTIWRWAVSFRPRPFYTRGKGSWYPMDRRLGGSQSRYGRQGKVKILDPTGTWIPIPWSSSQ
jgi:hypothetical protein